MFEKWKFQYSIHVMKQKDFYHSANHQSWVCAHNLYLIIPWVVKIMINEQGQSDEE